MGFDGINLTGFNPRTRQGFANSGRDLIPFGIVGRNAVGITDIGTAQNKKIIGRRGFAV